MAGGTQVATSSLLEKKYTAGGTIKNGHLVKFGADDDTVVECTANTDLAIGVANIPGKDPAQVLIGADVNVVLIGIAKAECGANAVTRGAKLMWIVNGVDTATDTKPVVGIALASAAATEYLPMLVVQSTSG